jgi:hypothetical protein
VPSADADWHLFVCDESGLAAVIVFADVAGPEEEQTIAATVDLTATWLWPRCTW